MNKTFFTTLLLLNLYIPLTSAATEEETVSAENILHKMSQATKTLNYELSYIFLRKNSIEPLLYRHGISDQKTFAYLAHLSGPTREVIRRGDEISYIDSNNTPFSIKSGNMVAPLMPMLNVDIDNLSQLYDFVKIGRLRESGSPCQVIRIVPKDGQRYSYVIWVDENSYLPLRADLMERNGDVLEQYRTISHVVDKEIAQGLKKLEQVSLPEVLELPDLSDTDASWRVTWVPNGFKAGALNRYRMGATDGIVESQIYNDGLFNFSVYVADANISDSQIELYRQGRRTLHTFVKENREISIIGDIPPATAKRIADSITFSE